MVQHKYLLSIVAHRLTGVAPEHLCSVLLDVLENGEWDSIDLDAPEPMLLLVVPDLIPRVIDRLKDEGYQIVFHGGTTSSRSDSAAGPHTVLSRDAPPLRITALRFPAHDSVLHEEEQRRASDNEILCRAGIVITVHGSALSLFVGCAGVAVARTWIEEAARASGLPVELRE